MTHSRLMYIASIIVALSMAAFAQTSEVKGIWRATPLSYPAVARLAQIQGDVRLKLVIDKNGSISASKLDGPEALATVVRKEIEGWRYTASNRAWQTTLVVHFSLKNPALPEAPVARVEINTPFDVSVSSNYPLPTGNPETMSPK